MEEKTIVKSKRYNPLIPSISIFSIGFITSLIWWISIVDYRIKAYNDYFIKYNQYTHRHTFSDYSPYCPICNNLDLIEYVTGDYCHRGVDDESIIPIAAGLVIAIILFVCMTSNSLTVTDKRIYGKTWFGKRVDLPVDSISAISSIGLLKGISVATSSGKLSFILIKNADEMYKELNNLIISRQSEKEAKKPIETIQATQNLSNADEIKKYKELLDMGIISQEEFDAKKKELLGL